MIIEKRWKHKGFECVVIFVGESHRCGYVAVPKDHIAYGKPYKDINVSVHGDLSFSAYAPEEDLGGKEGTYWLGFDCAQSNDKSKYHDEGHFWTLNEVIKETENLAKQLEKLQKSREG